MALRAGLIVVVLAGLALRVWRLPAGLPHFPFPDEPIMLRIAVGFGTGDLNPHFFGHPTLWPYVLFAAYGVMFVVGKLAGVFTSLAAFKAHYFEDPTAFYVAGRLLSALLGTALIPLAYGLSRGFGSPRSALFAAGAVAVAPLAVQYSHSMVTDGPLTVAVAVASLLIVRFMTAPSWGRLAAAGVGAGLAASIKYPGGALAIPLLFAALTRSPQPRAGRLAAAATAAVAMLAGFVLGTPFALLEPRAFFDDVRHPMTTARMPYPGFDPAVSALATYFSQTLPAGVGWTVAVLAGAGFVGMTWRAARRRDVVGVLPAVFAVPYLAVFGTGTTPFARYLMPLLPLVGVWAGFAIEQLVALGARAGRARQGLVWVVAAAALAVPLLGTVGWLSSLAKPDTRWIVRQWIERNVPTGSVIAVDRYPIPLRQSREHLALQIASLAARADRPRESERQLARWREKLATVAARPDAGPAFSLYALAIESPGPAEVDQIPYSLAAVKARGIRYVVVTSYVTSRFAQAPARFPEQIAFLRALADAGQLVFTIDPLAPGCTDDGALASPDVMVHWMALDPRCVVYNGPGVKVVVLD